MIEALRTLYKTAVRHQKEHACTAVPYDQGDLLTSLVKNNKNRLILEVGTGIGYSTACLSYGNESVEVQTIDKNEEHLSLANEYWKRLGVSDHITILAGKVEDILPTLSQRYDFIFYDGHVPQKKLVRQFYDLLNLSGILVTANLFLGDPSGGSYVRQLKDSIYWKTEIHGDTAVSSKV